MFVSLPGHMGPYDGGWMWFSGSIMMLFWVALIGVVVWAVLRLAGPQRGDGGVVRARSILAERYARGELSTEEYQERLRVLG